MTLTTALLLVFSMLVAGMVSFFQYFYKAKNKSNLYLFLAFVRFLSIWSVLVLCINPILKTNTVVNTPPVLAVVLDNSSSIVAMQSEKKAQAVYRNLISNNALKAKFDIQGYQFDSEFKVADTLDFKGKQTNLALVASNLQNNNRKLTYPTVLITDGNQTTGTDYEYSFDLSNKVFPVVLGDTTTVVDLKISQLNANKYAFYKNKFPVEVFLSYSGDKSIAANFKITNGNTVVNQQQILFSETKRTAILNLLLPADKLGTVVYKAAISANLKEKNTYNNYKHFAVEVLDQKTNIALVAGGNHPDVGALKRAIEANAQRKVTVFSPEATIDLKKYTVLILYQPTGAFRKLMEQNKQAKINTFVLTGTHTDFAFLNQQQPYLNFKMGGQREEYAAVFDTDFNWFATDNIGFERFPPLENQYGTVTTSANVSVLLWSRIRAIATNAPLLAFAESQGNRTAYLLGENSWKWRMQSHVNTGSYAKYDIFVDKIMQFLASKESKKALEVTHERFYNSGDPIEILAQYLDKNYALDAKARLAIVVTNTKNKWSKKYDLLKATNEYKVNLEGLPAGKYTFSVTELHSKATYLGQFEILDFDIEKQFVNPDVSKLRRLAAATNAKAYFPDQTEQLIAQLLQDTSYQTIQKTVVSKSPLIQWYVLLVWIILLLAIEWLVRKYNGLL
ncbi:hypothetical protein [Flavobacterium crassostreae]|uniref:VWA domain-containing protein n=1 Tax=Flavobacterium crassostreae TaxID=1763534 RepID=A0A1B9E9U7_9FLAO|nr:hypothetical protein [Flavobacterium crassostreae]OCB78734.1 hypothetical protein LPBF_01705 [Flavobacterium crassostreae]